MYYQKTGYTCGPASVRIAARVLGVQPWGEKRLAEAAGTTDEGSDEDVIKRAILCQGLTYDEKRCSSAKEFGYNVWYSLLQGWPLVTCVDRWQHWVCVIGTVGDRLLVADPANYGYNLQQNGLLSLSKTAFMRRAFAGRIIAKPFYALAVARSK